MTAPFTPGLPPAGAAGAFIGRDAQGNLWLLRWHDVAQGWEALGWVGAGRAAMPALRQPAGEDQGLITGHVEIAGSGASVRWPAPGARPADRHPAGVRALGPSPAWKPAVQRLAMRMAARQRAAAVNAEWTQVPVAQVLAEATMGVLYADLAELLEAAALHGPFGHLVGAVGLGEEHWRIEDNPCVEPGYFSLPMFTRIDPFNLMQPREGDQ